MINDKSVKKSISDSMVFDPRSTDAFLMDDEAFTEKYGGSYVADCKPAFFSRPKLTKVSFFAHEDFYVAHIIPLGKEDYQICFESVQFPPGEIHYISYDGRCSCRLRGEVQGIIYRSRREMIEDVIDRMGKAR